MYCVSTVQEEIGLRGATTARLRHQPDGRHRRRRVPRDRHAGQRQEAAGRDQAAARGPVLFRGPNINPRVFDQLEETAKAHEIPVQVRGVPRATGTDANAIQISRDGVATRPDRHPEPLHAQPGRGGPSRRSDERREVAGRVLRRGRRRRRTGFRETVAVTAAETAIPDANELRRSASPIVGLG